MGKIHIVLLLYALSMTTSLALASKKVNLIFPRIQAVKMDNCIFSETVLKVCNFTVHTRAAEYKLINFDMADATRGSIERSSDWKMPLDIRQEDLFLKNSQSSYLLLAERAEKWYNDNYKKNATVAKPLNWWIYDACTTLKTLKDEYELCIRDGAIYITSKKDKEFSKVMPMAMYSPVGSLQHSAQITAAVAIPIAARNLTVSGGVNPPTNGTISSFYLVAFTATGRMLTQHYSLTEFFYEVSLNILSTSVIDLSSIQNPSVNETATAWQKNWNFMDSTMKKKFEERLVDKMSSSYIEAITPIYPLPVNALLSLRNKRQANESTPVLINGTNLLIATASNTSTTPSSSGSTTLAPAPGNAEETIPLCLSRGYKMFDDKRRNVVCSHKGIDQSFYVDMPITTQTDTPYIIHAYHIGSSNGKRYFHLFYSIRLPTDNKMLYIHCEREGELNGTIQRKSDNLQLDGEINRGGCSPRDGFIDPPNDIVGFNYGGCNKVIAFHDFIYTVSDISVPLIAGNRRSMKFVKELSFKINAAFSQKNKIYFFTHTNHLVIVEASMDAACDQLTFKFDNIKQMFTEDFIYRHAFQKAGDEPLKAPYLVDYREFEEGASDSKPPMAFTSQDLPAFIPDRPTNPSKPGTRKEKSNIVIIAIGLIIGGLIIAAIIYLFCLRGKNDDEQQPMRVRKSKKSPYMDPDLMVKTVRSKHTMSSPPTPSQGSKILKSHKSMKSQKPALSGPTSGATSSPIKSSKSKVSLNKSKVTSPSMPEQKSKAVTSPTAPIKSKAASPSSPLKSNKSTKSLKSPKTHKSHKSQKSHKSHKSKRTTIKKT